MVGGEIDRSAVAEAFLKIKSDITSLRAEIEALKAQKDAQSDSKELLLLKETIKQLSDELSKLKNEKPQAAMDFGLIRDIVKETIKNVQPQKNEILIKKINKKRKSVLMSRILALAERKNMSIPDIKDVVVDVELLCSKATFYRHIEKMRQKGLIEYIKIGESQIVVKTE